MFSIIVPTDLTDLTDFFFICPICPICGLKFNPFTLFYLWDYPLSRAYVNLPLHFQCAKLQLFFRIYNFYKIKVTEICFFYAKVAKSGSTWSKITNYDSKIINLLSHYPIASVWAFSSIPKYQPFHIKRRRPHCDPRLAKDGVIEILLHDNQHRNI